MIRLKKKKVKIPFNIQMSSKNKKKDIAFCSIICFILVLIYFFFIKQFFFLQNYVRPNEIKTFINIVNF